MLAGAGDEVIMSIAGHVSRAMLSRYSHVRMRLALDEIAARRRRLAGEAIMSVPLFLDPEKRLTHVPPFSEHRPACRASL
jgi:hypothetical protein